MARKPEDLLAWQLCHELGVHVARMIEKGPASRDFDFCGQIRKSSRAAAPHIAEGFGRWGPKEFAQYLRWAVSTLMETRTHLAHGLEVKYFTPKAHADAATLCGRALRITKALLQSKLRQVEEEERKKKQKRKRPDDPDPAPSA